MQKIFITTENPVKEQSKLALFIFTFLRFALYAKQVKGCYMGEEENAFLFSVPFGRRIFRYIGKQLGQDSILVTDGDRHEIQFCFEKKTIYGFGTSTVDNIEGTESWVELKGKKISFIF
jgi:hypothetical protein